MNTVDIHDINPETTRRVSADDLAVFFNLFYRELVEELLEVFTDFTDVDIIQEIVDTVGLDYICVIENSPNEGLLIHGYITPGGVPA